MIPGASWPHTIRIVERVAGTDDAFGNPTITDAAPVTIRARVDSLSTSEDLGDRDQATERFMVILDRKLADGRGLDAIELMHTAALHWIEGNLDLEVDGPPARVDGAFGVHHYEVTAHRITG